MTDDLPRTLVDIARAGMAPNGGPVMTHDEAIARLVALDVARWGEAEREPSLRLNRKNYPTIGLALNRLAHYDLDRIDAAMAAEATRLMTADDKRILREAARS